MVTIWVVISALLIFLVLTRLMLNGFKNPVRKHEQTPDEIGIDFEEIWFKTKNNKKLYGWWVQKDLSMPIIVLVHGWGRNVGRMLPYIQHLNDSAFNLFAFDSRNHGKSETDKHSTMKKFAEDISAGIDFLQDKYKITHSEFGVVGLSIGGAGAIFASANDERIKSIITVGAFAHPADVMKIQLNKRHIPYYPLGWVLLQYMQLVIGLKFNDIAPENNIARTSAYALLIHGTKDETVPYEHANRLQTKSPDNTSIWLIEGKGHSDCHLEINFWNRLTGFLVDTLKKKPE